MAATRFKPPRMATTSSSRYRVPTATGPASTADRSSWSVLGAVYACPERADDRKPFLQIPGMVVTLYATRTPIPEEWKVELARYLANVQRNGDKDDQGWGL